MRSMNCSPDIARQKAAENLACSRDCGTRECWSNVLAIAAVEKATLGTVPLESRVGFQ